MPMETKELLEDLEAVDEEERLRQLKRRQRIDDMKLQKQKTMRMHRCILGAAVVVLLFAGFGIGAWLRSAIADTSEKVGEDNVGITDGGQGKNTGQVGKLEQAEDEGLTEDVGREDLSVRGIVSVLIKKVRLMSSLIPDAAGGQTAAGAQESAPPQEQYYYAFTAHSTEATVGFGDEIVSEFGILVDVEEGTIVAASKPHDRMNPASMTKILTVLTAAEILGIEDEGSPVLDDCFTMTIEITDYCYVNECSIAGFDVGETVSVRDLFYGTILPSGADAAVGLAVYVSGSQEEFVDRMNEKLKELRLSDTTHFTNCVGLYDENHYSTVYDIAVILKEAADNAFCRQVLSAHTYITSLTEQHPEGIRISNWFLRRIEDKDTHGEVLCGKTGYVSQSGSCAASLATDGSGREYLCVTAGSSGSWQCIADQTGLFQEFLPVDVIY